MKSVHQGDKSRPSGFRQQLKVIVVGLNIFDTIGTQCVVNQVAQAEGFLFLGFFLVFLIQKPQKKGG
jgi:hypothetical protein